MDEDLPRSLVAFEQQLEGAIRRQSDPAAAGHRGLLPRLRARAATTVAAAGVTVAGLITALVLVFGTSATAPAYAVTKHTNGWVTVRFLRPQALTQTAIDHVNARLAALHVRATVVHVQALMAATCPAAQGITINPATIHTKVWVDVDAVGRVELAQQLLRVNAKMHALIKAGKLPQSVLVPVQIPHSSTAANSGNSGNSGTAGNSGNSGNSGTAGDSGNSGTVGNSGNSGAGPASVTPAIPRQVAIAQAHFLAARCGSSAATGNSGNSGNSGSSGNSGNSGSSASSGSSANSGKG